MNRILLKHKNFYIAILALCYFPTTVFATIEQEGFRFRNDNGSETTASWIASQDTNISREININTRLRVLLNATGDPASAQYQLEYKKSTENLYKKISTTINETIAIRSETTGSGTTSAVDGTFTVNKPATVSNGDFIVVIVGKTDDPDVAPPAGFTTGGELGTTTGNDVFGGIYYKFITDASSEPASYTFDSAGTSESFMYWTGSLSGIDETNPEDVSFSTGSGYWVNLSNTSPNAPSVTTVTAGAFALAAWVVNLDTVTTQPGGSWASRADDVGSMNVVSQTFPTPATATGTPQITDVSGSQRTQTGTFVFRPLRYAFTLGASANITASGENTTFQLDAPAGKNTGDFVTGRMQDDENPADAVDITLDDYTELEWSIKATSYAVVGGVYTFRVTTAGVVLDTYSVTPQWTINAHNGMFMGINF